MKIEKHIRVKVKVRVKFKAGLGFQKIFQDLKRLSNFFNPSSENGEGDINLKTYLRGTCTELQGKETQTRGFIVSLGELQRSTARVGGCVDCTTEIWPSLNSSRKKAIVERNPSQVPVEAMFGIQQHVGEGTLGEILQKVGYVKTLGSLIQEALDFLLHN
ncbi:hypothetical protein AMECASPLE_023434 [Ameca splendens]|uniref:Uncharacterized protein n=1 Tax=Ameca splendens TaxID=208324 RepID=A0ABV0ZDN4_9TELE